MQFLIRTLTDSTGTPFTHVTKARDNETFQVVEAESKEDALEKAISKRDLLTTQLISSVVMAIGIITAACITILK